MNLIPSSSSPRRGNPLTLSLALIALALVVMTGCSALEEVVAEGEALLTEGNYLADVSGLVELAAPDQRNGAWVTAAEGSEIAAGTRLRTADGGATIAFAGGSTAELEPNSEIAITEVDLRPEADVEVIRLEQVAGRTRHVVANDDGSELLYEVRTPEGTTTTMAATFLVAVPVPGQTHIMVSDGVVETAGVDQVRHVAAGRATTLVAGGPPAPGAFVFQARGLVTQLTAETMVVAGRVINLYQGTFLEPGLEINQIVFVEGTVAEDGSLLAHRVVVAGDDDDLALVGDADQTITLDDGDCVVRSGVVVGLDALHVTLQDGTRLEVDQLEDLDGQIALYDTVLIITCRQDDGTIENRIVQLDRTDEAVDQNGLITVCHLPAADANQTETVMVAEAAVAEHMLHGDYIGACAPQSVFFDVGQPDAGSASKVTICHRPPGNPANQHTITIGEPAVDAHLAHGDVVGACANGDGRPGGNNGNRGNTSNRAPQGNS